MDSFTDLVLGTGSTLFSAGFGYGFYKDDKGSNKFSRYSVLTGLSLVAIGSSIFSVRAGCRFLKAG